jgi:DNA-binding response OmpR family regulator
LARILVIENDVAFLDLLRVHLTGAGHEVVTAEDAALGLRAVIEDAPDVIILDIFVPYLNGIEVLEALRTDPATAPIPVIVLTGTRDEEIYAKARKLGVADYLTKPVQRDKLLQTIDAILARPTAPR